MEGKTTLKEAKEIMGLNMIGPDELKKINDKDLFLNLELISKKLISIPFEKE